MSQSLDSKEIARYSRQILLPQIGLRGQEKLKGARVLLIGAGGLGSPAGLYLGSAGIGTLGIADFDSIEEHNLHRQIIHDAAGVGLPKTESAAERLRKLNPDVEIELHTDGINPENAVRIFEQYDLIVDGSDNFSTRYLNNDAAFFAGKPLVYGSIFRFEGQVSVFDPTNEGPCYRCLFPVAPAPGTVPNCGEAGVIGALCGVVGSLQAMEAIKRILDIGDPLQGSLLVINLLGMNFQKVRIKKDPKCPLCSKNATITAIVPENYRDTCEVEEPVGRLESEPLEVDVIEAKRLLDEEAGVLLVDVREPFECEICQIEGSLSIPMGKVSQNLDQLSRDRRILIYCHYGGRSRQVTEYLRRQGYERVSNIAGGIDAWAAAFDEEMQRY